MGNCLKKNKVEPLAVRDNNAEMLDRGTPDKRSARSKHADMVQSLMDEGNTPNVAKDGLAFVVDFSPSKKGKKGQKPPNIGKKAGGEGGSSTTRDPDMPEYSLEEKTLMAEIMRQEHLKERKEKARNVDMKAYDAKRKRMAFECQAEANRKEEQEKAAMAEIAREQKRQEQKEKARQAEMKAYDVKRKKMALEAHAEALRKQQETSGVLEKDEGSSDGAATSAD